MIGSIFSSIKKWGRRLFPFVFSLTLLFVFFYKEYIDGLRLIQIFLRGGLKYHIFLLGQIYRAMFFADIKPYLTPEYVNSLVFLFFSTVIFSTFYQISLFLAAQFVLPVNTYSNRIKAYKYLIKYSKGKHGPAIFVREGEQVKKPMEAASSKPGVILVDLSSAVALRKQEKVKPRFLIKGRMIESDIIEDIETDHKKDLKKSAVFLDAKGPGVVFTEAGQSIIATLDLRKQSRSSDEIEAYTRDGIRVKTKVRVTFSLSDDPEIISVGAVRDKNEVKGLVFSSKDPDGRIKLRDIFDLEEEDAIFIANFIKNGWKIHQNEKEAGISVAPYNFFPDRVLKAAYSRARKIGGELKPWYDTPLELATDMFRKMLSGIQYDDLFSSSQVELSDASLKMEGNKNASPLFISTFRKEFERNVKMKGLLKFQLCKRKDGLPFVLGQLIDFDVIEEGVPIAFPEPKYNSVRKYGITILSAGFGDIRPADPKIQDKMVENWKTRLQNEINLIRAEYELEAIRVKNRNRAQIQHETTYLLSSIFQEAPHFEEALALRVLNALETAVTDPLKQEITSSELYAMLENLYQWLLSEGEETPLPPLEAGSEDDAQTRQLK